MGRSGLNKIQQEMYFSWGHCRKVCTGNGKVRENVPLQKEWQTFDGFYKANYQRYYRARKKWMNYIRVAPRPDMGMTGKLKHRPIRLIRKVKELGFTKKNTVWTGLSDRMKYFKGIHKYMFEGQMLGTRDIKNILAKRNIFLNMETITQRLRRHQNLFEASPRYPAFHKGVYRSYREVAEMEQVSHDLLKTRITRFGMTFNESLAYCKKYHQEHAPEYKKKKLLKTFSPHVKGV